MKHEEEGEKISRKFDEKHKVLRQEKVKNTGTL